MKARLTHITQKIIKRIHVRALLISVAVAVICTMSGSVSVMPKVEWKAAADDAAIYAFEQSFLSNAVVSVFEEEPAASASLSAEPSSYAIETVIPEKTMAEEPGVSVSLPSEQAPYAAEAFLTELVPVPDETGGLFGVPSSSPKENKVAFLTFDDGPCIEGDSPTQNTGAILDMLAKYDIKATFFVIGAHARKYPDIILRAFNEGHTIGNHTYSHVDPRTTDDDKFLRQVRSTNSVLKRITGVKPEYFRSPYGAPLTSGQRKGLHLKLIGWDVDTLDWSKKTSLDDVVEKVRKAAEKGMEQMRILFHDRHSQGLGEVIRLLKSYGYKFDTIDHWRK